MSERRLDPTTGEWRSVDPSTRDDLLPSSADGCPLCPTRPDGPATRIPLSSFEVVVLGRAGSSSGPASEPPTEAGPPSLYAVDAAIGPDEVVVYSDDHDLHLAGMGRARIAAVVDVWADRYAELGGRDEVAYVFISEDRKGVPAGGAEGATAVHPHARIHAYREIPPRPRAEIDTALAHLGRFGTCVFCDVVARELADGVRLVARNASFLAFVPFAPRFPYEVHVISHRHAASLLDLTDPERTALAGLLERVLVAYDELSGVPLPYAMALHQAPTDDGQHQSVSHFHVELTPSGHAVGASELGAGAFVTDLAPEEAATRLRDLVGGR